MKSLPVSERIQLRTSWRSCTGESLAPDTLKQLKDYVLNRSQEGAKDQMRIELVAARESDTEELKGLGTYGFIRGASAFIVGAVDKSGNQLETYGRLVEDIVLFATGLGLATCWLGGSFRKDNFSARINVQDHEIVPAVVSVGMPANNRNMVDRLIRNVAGSRKRLPWEKLFFEADAVTPLSGLAAGRFKGVLEMVRLSPSASNKQPWRLVIDQENVHFFLKRTKGYRKPMFSDLQRIDMGIAMSHFQGVCQELEMEGTWERKSSIPSPPEYWEYITTWVTRSSYSKKLTDL